LNQLKHFVSGSQEWLYLYDADDERLWSYQPGVPGTSVRFDRWTIRDLAGKVLRTYEASGYNWTGSDVEDSIYRDGVLLAAELPNTAAIHHFHLDHLGTPRLITDLSHAQVAYHAYFPFGEEATPFNQDTERMKFTGHERDLASAAGAGDDLDYMHARHESPVTGRFLSMDRHFATLLVPQTLNRYVLSRDNPLKFFDPNGLDAIVPAWLKSTIDEGRERSTSFRALFDRIAGDYRIMMLFERQEKPKPGSRIDSDQVITRDAGTMKIISLVQRVSVPFRETKNVASIGHELYHGEETLDRGKTLRERYKAGDPTVRPNSTGYESQGALDFEKTVHAEESSPPSQGNQVNLFDAWPSILEGGTFSIDGTVIETAGGRR